MVEHVDENIKMPSSVYFKIMQVQCRQA